MIVISAHRALAPGPKTKFEVVAYTLRCVDFVIFPSPYVSSLCDTNVNETKSLYLGSPKYDVSFNNNEICNKYKISDDYFARPVLRMLINQPLVAAERVDQFDVTCSVTGGGLSGQAGAIRHGISKCLVNFEPEVKKALKPGGFLTRDSRVVERKKYGRAKARRSYQFSKR